MANEIKISDFFKDEVPGYAAYDNMRKIASYADGLKISMRKILFTLSQRQSTDKMKTENLANLTAAETNYLHGANNLCGVCNTLAQSFVGANNFPLLDGNSGGFGTRIDPTCAAPRYTKVALSNTFRKMFSDVDMKILERQVFEGDLIEPQFMVPVFPVLFLNGVDGISVGFNQVIYPRNPEEIIDYIRKRLSGTAKPRMKLLPWFKGFKGSVRFNEETKTAECVGCIVKNNSTSYTVTEIPIGTDFQGYKDFLQKLEDDHTIVEFKDKCDTKTDTILFEIKTTREFTKKHSTEESLFKVFKLVKNLPEQYRALDEFNRVREFNDIYEILDSYLELRLKYYGLRRDYLMKSLHASIDKAASKYLFCSGIIQKKIKVSNVKKSEIISQLEKFEKIIKVDGSYSYLLNMPIHSISSDTLAELKKQIENMSIEYKRIKGMTPDSMWIEDLNALAKTF